MYLQLIIMSGLVNKILMISTANNISHEHNERAVIKS